jgi:hypothetical protein
VAATTDDDDPVVWPDVGLPLGQALWVIEGGERIARSWITRPNARRDHPEGERELLLRFMIERFTMIMAGENPNIDTRYEGYGRRRSPVAPETPIPSASWGYFSFKYWTVSVLVENGPGDGACLYAVRICKLAPAAVVEIPMSPITSPALAPDQERPEPPETISCEDDWTKAVLAQNPDLRTPVKETKHWVRRAYKAWPPREGQSPRAYQEELALLSKRAGRNRGNGWGWESIRSALRKLGIRL